MMTDLRGPTKSRQFHIYDLERMFMKLSWVGTGE